LAVELKDPPVILLIDDEPEVLEALRTQLKDRFGTEFEIETASNGAEAIALVKELMEDGVELTLVISDEIMPQMRGHEVLAALHEIAPKAKTILLTGQADTYAIVEAVNRADLFHFIAKPWDSIDLLLTVKRAAESYAEQELRIARLRMFHRFVPADFLSLLDVADPIETRVGMGITQDMAVLFTDIRGFSTMSENLEPNDVFKTLNDFFQVIVPAVVDNGGVIDKFVGDGVMALFTHPDHAVQAGVRIVRETQVLDSRLGRTSVGVGINWGELLLGTVGTEDRIQTTVVGDVVNVAARLEGITKYMATPLLISESIALHSHTSNRYLGRHPIRGRKEKVGLFQVLDLLEPESRAALEASRDEFEPIASLIGTVDVKDICPQLQTYVDQHPSDEVAAQILHVLCNFGVYATVA
jgi:two-component system sensor histidine kinase ChiS